MHTSSRPAKRRVFALLLACFLALYCPCSLFAATSIQQFGQVAWAEESTPDAEPAPTDQDQAAEPPEPAEPSEPEPGTEAGSDTNPNPETSEPDPGAADPGAPDPGAGEPEGDGSGAGDPETGEPEGDESGDAAEPADPKVNGLQVYEKDNLDGTLTEVGNTNYAIDYDANGKPAISSKGGTMQLVAVVEYDNWDEDPSGSHVEWRSSDSSVATVGADGVVQALSDGNVTIEAYLPAEYCVDGVEVVCSVPVVITGQSASLYVSGITLLYPDGTPATYGGYGFEAPLDTALEQFYAQVTVVDSATNEETVYDTRDGSLSSQVEGLGDVQWYVDDTEVAYVEEYTGQFRPFEPCKVTLTCYSAATLTGTAVQASTTVTYSSPDEETNPDYAPQSELHVYAYYGELPRPDASNPDDPNWVIRKTLTVADLESLYTDTKTYTTFGSGGTAYTTTARGAGLAQVLNLAGIDVAGIDNVEVYSAHDGVGALITADYLFNQPHYYYPNANDDSNRQVGAEQVFPILALESYTTKVYSLPQPDEMNDATRFRLVCGAVGIGDQSANYMIKWITDIYVCLTGSEGLLPPGGSDEGTSSTDGPSNNATNGGSGDEGTEQGDANAADGEKEKAANGAGSGNGASSGGNGSSSGGGSAASSQGLGSGSGSASHVHLSNGPLVGQADAADSKAAEASADQPSSDASGESGGEPEGSKGEEQGGGGQKGTFKVYQLPQKYHHEAEAVVVDNPLLSLTAPLGACTMAVGGVQAVWWYRRQTRPLIPTQKAAPSKQG
ncbi:Ig-like domain-containing protein [Xiamenia xianingshaonis]|uniref:Ig-like domain-containing protein n=1 Tax=Xiamenia xianingshaonis TaxID=2682776 RepID=UPI00140D0D17|nr:Ig-like domain-containing protein [Xiamenia xianingshaonis]